MHLVESKFSTRQSSMYHALLAGALTALPFTGCGGKQARAEGAAQPLEERRALHVIGNAIEDEGLTPVVGRTVAVGGAKALEMDVGVEAHKYGVAYTAESERAALGAALAPRELEGQLQLVYGTGADEGAQVLVLHMTDYMLDDHLGTSYEASTITAERKLGRDVRDFVVEAREKRWP